MDAKHRTMRSLVASGLAGAVLVAGLVVTAPAWAASGGATARGRHAAVNDGPSSSGSSSKLSGSSAEWRLQHVLDPPVQDAFIFDASCAGADFCIAVGRNINDVGIWAALAEAWNGNSWTIDTTPDPSGSTDSELEGVSCTASDACTAVGFFDLSSGKTKTLAEAWNGSSWTIQPTPNPKKPRLAKASELFAVSCLDAQACTAVGSSYIDAKTVTLAEAWNGTSWKIQATPTPAGTTGGYLQGVSCSGGVGCEAVGYSLSASGVAKTLAEASDGASWKAQATPNPSAAIYSDLSGVSCPARDACTAVGSFDLSSGKTKTLAETWNGSSWTIQSTPNVKGASGSSLFGVSCAGAGGCTAVGAYEASGDTLTLAEEWDGTSWTIAATPNPRSAGHSYLQAVSCTKGADCFAVGYAITSSGVVEPLAEGWDGSSWKIQLIPNPTGSITSGLSAVSCTSDDACATVGSYYIDTSGIVVTLAEVWDGSSWKIEPTPDPSGATTSGLVAVSCSSAESCTAVGYYAGSSGLATLAEGWNGSSWKIEATPEPTGAEDSELTGVSCTSLDTCTAVGYYFNASGEEVTLAEVWDGTSWTVQATSDAPGATSSQLLGVSCTPLNACTAVGFDVGSTGIPSTLAEEWDGSSWNVQSTPNPVGGTRGSYLTSVSCTGPDACTASGYDTNSSDTLAALVEIWSGSTWAIETVPDPSGASGSELSAVSCGAANACTAVGYYINSSGDTVVLAELSHGTSWMVQATPDPAGAPLSELSGLSCTAKNACTAVGFHTKSSGLGSTTLAEVES